MSEEQQLSTTLARNGDAATAQGGTKQATGHPSVDEAVAEEIEPGASDYHVLDDRVVYVVVFLGTLLTTGLPVFLGQRFCLPLLNGLVIAPLFIWALRAGRPRRAVELGLFWSLCQTAAMLAATLLLPEQTTIVVLRGLDFRTEMLAWVNDGQGSPGLASEFVPRAAGNYAIFSGLSLVTGSIGGLIFLASLLNTYNFYVATLVQQVVNPLLLIVLAWPLWLIVRLIGYLVTGAVLAEPVAVLDLRPQWWSRWWRDRRRLLVIGIGLVVMSLLLQLILAPLWPSLLRLTIDTG